MSSQPCAGCGQPCPPHTGKRPRKWCSGACRTRHTYHSDSRYRERQSEASARRHRERMAERGTPIAYAECAECSSLFVHRAGRPRLTCSTVCRSRRNHRREDRTMVLSHRRKANSARRARKRTTEVEPIDHASVFVRDAWVCGLCQEPVDPELAWPHPRSASLDHVVPLALGGAHTYANVQCAHLGCNAAKGARVQESAS